MNATETDVQVKSRVKVRLSPCSLRTRDAIDEFLRHWHDRIELSLNDHRAIAMTQRDDRLTGVIEYQRHQLSTIRSLIASNAGRRLVTRTTRPR